MFGSILGGILGIGGAALGADAAGDAASAQIRAGRENREYDERNLSRGTASYLASMLGSAEAERYLRGSMGDEQFNKLFRTDEAKGRA